MKIIDKIEERVKEGHIPFCSFEYFPPKTEIGRENLLKRVQRMVKNLGPLFIDVTWGAGGSTSELTIQLASHFQKYSGVEVLMHLTCTNMSIELLDSALEQCKEHGINNILALRGDPPHGQENWSSIEGGFTHANELVEYIRRKHGDYFCIGVAGYSDTHPDSPDRQTDLQNLKRKIDAGADFVITQLFYSTDNFIRYMNDCKAIGINAPILPGIMPIQTYAGWMRMVTTCSVDVPQEIYDAMEPLKQDDDAVKEYGITLCVQLCKRLIDAGVLGLHLYTLNLEKSVWQIMERLDLIRPLRDMPWRGTANRHEEAIRPIYWSHRPSSYVDRTATWDEYPNGRWGDSRSAAYGVAYPLGYRPNVSQARKDKLIESYGTPESERDVAQTFTRFVRGEISEFPWYEEAIESNQLKMADLLVLLNEHNFLTVTSQTPVNGAKSDDPDFGWGPAGGYVYAKGFLELFVPSRVVATLKEVFSEFPSIAYQIGNVSSDEIDTNLAEDAVIALAWGVFPNREIQQPTILDVTSFKAWKEEAFGVWMYEWGNLYPAESASRRVLQEIHDNYSLVNIVDNDYVTRGNFETIFNEVFRRLGNQ